MILAVLAGCPHVELDPKKSNTRLDICKDDWKRHELEAAKTECDRAISFNPKNDEAYLWRGIVALTRVHDTEQTLEIDGCLTGLDAESTHKDLESALHEADHEFEQALKVSPEYGDAWADRGAVHNLLEDYATGEKYLQTALGFPARLTEPGLARANLAWSLFNQHKEVDAARELRASRQFQPKMCVATYRLGRVYFARGEWDKAAEYFQTVSDDPSCGSQEASLYLMKTKLQQGLVDDAREARDACLKLSPQSCNAAQCKAEGGALGASKPKATP
jgi:tetratricopeptide (TPR) repeat protein